MEITFNHFRGKKKKRKYFSCLFGNKHLVKSTKIFNEMKGYIFQFVTPPIMNIPGNYQKEHQHKIPILQLG